MARRRYYRRSVRVVAARKKWASNLKNGSIASSGTTLVVNSSQSDVPTPVILKTGNFKVQGDVAIVSSSSTGTASLVIYLAYVPEGYGISNLAGQHPEYILGWTIVDAPVISAGTLSANKYSITSRLKRNLNSGDRIVLFYEYTTTASDFAPEISYTAQYFTCAN